MNKTNDMENNKEYLEQLNILLASYQMHYQNLRSLHWNVKGNSFFELHVKYEELYTRAQVIVDDVAERILSVGGTPLSRFSDYIEKSVIKEAGIISDGKTGVTAILEDQIQLLALERNLLDASDKLDDEGTNSLMSDLIREKEKTNWMFKAYLDK